MADETNITETEEWRDVVGWEGLYLVSSHGQVKRLPSVVRGKGGSFQARPGTMRKPYVDPDTGYQMVKLCDGPKKTKHIRIHILVCTAFHGPKPGPKFHVAHWDGDNGNNRKSNLRWATARENAQDQIRHGRTQIGEKNVNAKLDADKVRVIRARYSSGESLLRISKSYGVSDVSIHNIITGKTWKHVT